MLQTLLNVVPNEATLIAYMAYTMIFIGLAVFFILLFINAPYGRYSSSAWGPLINAKVAWFIQEIPALLIPLFYIFKYPDSAITNKIMLIFFVIHYIHRAAIYPFLINNGKPLPLAVFLIALVCCTYNAFMQTHELTMRAEYPQDWFMKPAPITGMFMFVSGMFINIYSDHTLRTLRKPGETGYKIPRGGAFEYVSGANFMGEIIEWSGFALMTQTLPAVAFAIFTACNLAPRAISHHKWYLSKFEDYPKTRKAVIPFML